MMRLLFRVWSMKQKAKLPVFFLGIIWSKSIRLVILTSCHDCPIVALILHLTGCILQVPFQSRPPCAKRWVTVVAHQPLHPQRLWSDQLPRAVGGNRKLVVDLANPQATYRAGRPPDSLQPRVLGDKPAQWAPPLFRWFLGWSWTSGFIFSDRGESVLRRFGAQTFLAGGEGGLPCCAFDDEAGGLHRLACCVKTLGGSRLGVFSQMAKIASIDAKSSGSFLGKLLSGGGCCLVGDAVHENAHAPTVSMLPWSQRQLLKNVTGAWGVRRAGKQVC